jgi:hypothetical protein
MTASDLDVRAIAEALAEVLAERGLVVSEGSSGRVLDAAAVAGLLGRDRQWVYEHAEELGAFRYGDGPRARLGFDMYTLEAWKRGRRLPTAEAARRGGRRRARKEAAVSPLIPYEGSGRGA